MTAGDVRLITLVSGRVQGVGYRAWARDQMRALGLTGSATNLPDGRVEVVAEGPRATCEQLLAAMRGSDPPGRATDVTPSWTGLSR
jgi:acylphosphatase